VETKPTASTPGPWAITRRWPDGKRIIIEGHAEEWERLEVHVVSDDCDYATAEANARLIVKAWTIPALLEACIDAVARMTEARDCAPMLGAAAMDRALLQIGIDKARAAIALAEKGE